jgi:hypothetical protein
VPLADRPGCETLIRLLLQLKSEEQITPHALVDSDERLCGWVVPEAIMSVIYRPYFEDDNSQMQKRMSEMLDAQIQFYKHHAH